MRSIRLAALCGLPLLVSATPALAQSRGTIEVGGFGALTSFPRQQGLALSQEVGARVGVFFGSRWSLAGSGALSVQPVDPGPRYLRAAAPGAFVGANYRHNPYWLHLNYARQIGETNSAVTFGGGVTAGQDQYARHYGPSGIVGVRFGLNQAIGLRVDGVADYMPEPRRTHLSARAGLSVFGFGGRGLVRETSRGEVDTAMLAANRAAEAERMRLMEVERSYMTFRDSVMRNEIARQNALMESMRAAATVRRTVNESKVYFRFNRYVLTDSGKAALDAVIPYFQQNPEMTILVAGNADKRGAQNYNYRLGLRRAEATKTYLVSRGIDASRIRTVSFGEDNPQVHTSDNVAHGLNRRSEFMITATGEAPLTLPAGAGTTGTTGTMTPTSPSTTTPPSTTNPPQF